LISISLEEEEKAEVEGVRSTEVIGNIVSRKEGPRSRYKVLRRRRSIESNTGSLILISRL
jgi:hypothetical protein